MRVLFIRINLAFRFPCALSLQILELYSFLIKLRAPDLKFGDRLILLIEYKGPAKAALNAIDGTVARRTQTVVFSH
jgi:hypothetical protein